MAKRNISEQRNDTTVAITGAAGYIGSRVVAEMQQHHPEWKLIAVDNQYRGQVDSISDVDIGHVDIRNRSRLENSLTNADVVCHLAAVSGVDDCAENADTAYEVNITCTTNIAWFCRKTGAALIFPFSMAVLGDPESFPITATHSRDPLNWYGRTKLLGEQSIKTFAEESFPTHLFLKSNLYGSHQIGDTVVSKPTVINYFVDCALNDEPLTVYEPGTQARNFVHVKDVALAYVQSTERLLEQLGHGQTGAKTFEIASHEEMSVLTIAETVRDTATDLLDTNTDIDIDIVENPRAGETMVEDFTVDISAARNQLDWNPTRNVRDSVRQLLQRGE